MNASHNYESHSLHAKASSERSDSLYKEQWNMWIQMWIIEMMCTDYFSWKSCKMQILCVFMCHLVHFTWLGDEWTQSFKCVKFNPLEVPPCLRCITAKHPRLHKQIEYQAKPIYLITVQCDCWGHTLSIFDFSLLSSNNNETGTLFALNSNICSIHTRSLRLSTSFSIPRQTNDKF